MVLKRAKRGRFAVTGEDARPTLWRGRPRPRWGVACNDRCKAGRFAYFALKLALISMPRLCPGSDRICNPPLHPLNRHDEFSSSGFRRDVHYTRWLFEFQRSLPVGTVCWEEQEGPDQYLTGETEEIGSIRPRHRAGILWSRDAAKNSSGVRATF